MLTIENGTAAVVKQLEIHAANGSDLSLYSARISVHTYLGTQHQINNCNVYYAILNNVRVWLDEKANRASTTYTINDSGIIRNQNNKLISVWDSEQEVLHINNHRISGVRDALKALTITNAFYSSDEIVL